MEIDTRSFVSKCCTGSESAWSKFFELFHPLIAGTVRKIVEFDQEDVVQTVYFKLIEDNYRLLRNFRGDSFYELLAYIRQISHNVAANHRRSQGVEKSQTTSIDDFLELLTANDTPETRYLQLEASSEIMAAVMSLDAKYREPAYLLMQGYKHKEIAGILAIPIDTASTRIRRAYQKLEENLKELVKK
ncbi:MAG: RNA polymerase sigma factor [Spirochaetota bacterium]